MQTQTQKPEDWQPTHRHVKSGNRCRLVRRCYTAGSNAVGIIMEDQYGIWRIWPRIEIYGDTFEELKDANDNPDTP